MTTEPKSGAPTPDKDGVLTGAEIENWKSHLQEALDVADALLWDRIQRGKWRSPRSGRLAMQSHKKVEECKEALMEIDAEKS